jgi:hypothetical protein
MEEKEHKITNKLGSQCNRLYDLVEKEQSISESCFKNIELETRCKIVPQIHFKIGGEIRVHITRKMHGKRFFI